MLVDKNKIIEGDSAQFNLALSTHFLSINENPETRLGSQDKYQLADCLYGMLKNVDRWDGSKADLLIKTLEKRSGLKMNPIERAEFQFNVMALDDFDNVSKLDNPLSHLLAQCRYHLLINSLIEKQFLLSHHPLKQLVDFVHDNLLGFDAKFGKVLLPLYEFTNDIVEAVKKTPWNDSLGYQKLMQKADVEIKALTERFFMIADRMIATETGHLKAQQAKETVYRFMATLLQGKKLPEDVSQTIIDHITDELKILVATEGALSSRWLRVSKMLETLVDLYQPQVQIDKRTQTLWQELPDELASVLEDLNIHSAYVDKWLDTIRYDFYHLSRGLTLDSLASVVVPFNAIQEIAESHQIDNEYTQKAKSYSDGQWFLYKKDNQVHRVYLSLKLATYGQYLFINILGQKTLSLDILVFSDYLKSGLLSPLMASGVCIQLYSLAVDKILQDFYERYNSHMNARKRTEAQARQLQLEAQEQLSIKHEAQERLAFEQRKQNQEAEIRRIAQAEALEQKKASERRLQEERARALEEQLTLERNEMEAETARIQKAKEDTEAARIAELERKEAEKRQMQLAREQLSDDIVRQTRLALDTMALGGKIDFFAQNGQPVRAKLAVKFNATRRYVFIDHDGFTILDAQRNDVLELILDGKVVLIDADQKFNTNLASVIRSIQEAQA